MVHLLVKMPVDQAESAAESLGFVRPVEVPTAVEPRSVGKPAQPSQEQPAPETPAELLGSPVPLFRLEEMTFPEVTDEPETESDQTGLLPSDLSAPDRSLQFTPTPEPLAPWSRLWPALHGVLQSSVPSSVPDVAKLVRKWGRGEVVERIPRLPRRVWADRVALWVDRHPRLVPFHFDQEQVYQRLRRSLGTEGLKVRVIGPVAQASVISGGSDYAQGHRFDARQPVLVLGDLGAYGTIDDRSAWKRTGQRLRRSGVQAVALLPVPKAAWPQEHRHLWSRVSWERGRLANVVSAKDELPDFPRRSAERLMPLLSPADFVHLGLMRAVRRLLPASETSAATEVEICRHPDVCAVDSTGLVLRREAATRYRERFADDHDAADLKVRLSQIIQAWHKDCPEMTKQVETLTWLGLVPRGVAAPPGPEKEAMAFASRLATSIRKGREPASLAAAIRRGTKVMLSALPDRAFETQPILRPLWAAAFAGQTVHRVPKSIDPSQIFPKVPTDVAPQWWSVRQVGDELWVRREESSAWPSAARGPGSPVAWLVTTDRHLFARWSDSTHQQQLILKDGLKIPLRTEGRLTLRSNRSELIIAPWPREPWATAAGRDRYGLWADATIEGIAVRFRYIPPGRFQMGSPESEEGRHEEEGPQHEVTWTQGYWLADAPCTQAVWERVMGGNPSYFTSADRPVEKVSWDDCQEFVKRLNESSPELMARLPSEAEWEHACRGGTPTATWVGDLEILGDYNAPLLDEIAWYGGNSGQDYELAEGWDTSDWPDQQYPHTKAGTHEVRKKQANPHGLHDMLGNVLEWCMDTYGSYEEPAVTNPAPSTMGSGRVTRGGSWRDFAWYVRAAIRYGFSPDDRDYYLGFRLARGQGGWEAGTRSGPAGRGEGLAPAASALREAGTTPARSADHK